MTGRGEQLNLKLLFIRTSTSNEVTCLRIWERIRWWKKARKQMYRWMVDYTSRMIYSLDKEEFGVCWIGLTCMIGRDGWIGIGTRIANVR